MEHPSNSKSNSASRQPAARRRGKALSAFFLYLFAAAGAAWGVVVVNDPFTDGNRSNTTGGDTSGLVWFQGQPSPATLTVVDDSAGIGSGNAVRLTPDIGNFRKFLAFFATQTLAADGDTLRLNFNYRFATAPTTGSAGLRFGFYNSNATKQTSDSFGTTTPPATTRNDDKGYLASANAGVAPTLPTAVNRENAGDDIMGGSTPGNVVALNSAGGTVASGTLSHHARFQITRQGGNLELTAQIDGLTVTTGTELEASVLTYGFDELAIGLSGTGNQAPMLVDTVLVEFINVFAPTRVSWYKAENGTQDSAGVKPAAIVDVVTYAPVGATGLGFAMTGNGHVEVPNPRLNEYSTGFTVAAWFQINAWTPTAPLINFRDVSNNGGFMLEQDGLTGDIHLDVQNGHPVYSQNWATNTLYHIAATFDGPSGKLVIYRNGVPLTNRVDPSYTMDLVATPTLHIGRNIVSGVRWNGLIDEVQIHNRALTQTEIIGLMGLPTVTVAATNTSEGGSGTFTFTRSSSSGSLTVNYALSGTAISGLDYLAQSGVLNFPDGVAAQTVTISPVTDAFIDPNDTVIATVIAGAGYTPGGTATMTITDTTTSPRSVLPKDPLSVQIPSGTNPPSPTIVPVTGQSFPQALRVVTPDYVSTDIYADAYFSQVNFNFNQAVSAGDVLLVSLWARAVNGDANGEAFLRPRINDVLTNSVNHGDKAITVGAAWRRIQFPVTLTASYASGTARLRIFVGYGPQTLEIGGISVVNYGAVPYSTLAIPLYEGRGDPNAAWRAPAAGRIEQNRKGNFIVQVRDTVGNPVSGASVAVKMKRHAFGFGAQAPASRIVSTDTTPATYLANQALRDTLLGNCNWAVLGNDLKWPNWETADGTFNTTSALNSAHWFFDHGMNGFRAHNLVWPSWSHLPAWLKTGYETNVPALRQRVRDHITQEAAAVGTLATRWDVLNEPFANHNLQDILGRTEIKEWFRTARNAAPGGTRLVLNDYDTQGEDLPHINFQIRTIQETELGESPPLIDGIGLQAHHDFYDLTSMDRVKTVLDRYAALGKQIEITEFDLSTKGDEALQADYLRDYLTLAFSHPAVRSFLLWTIWEGNTVAGQSDRALFSTDFSIKPNGQAWQDLIFTQWWTDTTSNPATTDASGNVTVRGFLGDYDITATSGSRTLTVAAPLGASDTTVTLVPRNPTTVLLTPNADTYVQNDLATANFGSVNPLVVKLNSAAANNNRDAYLKFDLGTVPAVFSAKLRLFAGLSGVTTSTATFAVSLSACAVADTTWSETAMTWNTRPALGAVLGNVNVTGTMPNPAAQWVELDVTAYLQAEKVANHNVVTFGLHDEVVSDPRIFISSRESADAPQLVITAPLVDATTGAASSVTSSGATVEGTVAANNVSTAVVFEYGTSTGYGNLATAIQSPVTGAAPTAVNAPISGLLPATLYHYRVKATDSVGTATGNDATFTTGAAPPAVTLASATGVLARSATLNGTTNPNGASTVPQFQVGLTTAYDMFPTLSPINGTTAQAVSAGLSGLQPGTTYYFRLRAINSEGMAATSGSSFTTLTLQEAWRMQYFGITTNSKDAADGVDPDGDGATNLFEYVAGLSPTDPTSRFALRIEAVPGQPMQRALVFSPLAAGRTYTVKSKASLSEPTWMPLANSSAPVDNGNERKVVDLGADPSPKFYVVEIALP